MRNNFTNKTFIVAFFTILCIAVIMLSRGLR